MTDSYMMMNPSPIVVNQFPMNQQARQLPARQSVPANQVPNANMQGTIQGQHQGVYGKVPPPPPQQAANKNGGKQQQDSTLKLDHSSTNLLGDQNKKSGAGKGEKKTTTTRKGSASKKSETTATKKASNPSATTAKQRMERIGEQIGKQYNFKNYIDRKDRKGTIWMKQIAEDSAPKRITDIPTDPKNNEVEIVYWQQYNGKTSIGFLLHTVLGVRYWADSSSIRWLKSAELDGIKPGKWIFVIKHDKKTGFQYGFRKLEGDDDDEEMGKDKEEIEVEEEEKEAEEEGGGVKTPELNDDDDDDN